MRTEDTNDARPVRLELKQGMPRTGFVDGAWWPRSRDLRAEAPGLVAAVHAQLRATIGPVLRIGFGTGEWNPTGRQRLDTPAGRVAFGGFDVFAPDTVWVTSYSTALEPLVLVVIPPETPDARAADTMRRASISDNRQPQSELLAGEIDGPEAPNPPVYPAVDPAVGPADLPASA
jgi:hypothetical protein